MGNKEALLTGWETALTNPAVYSADDSVGDSEEEV